MQMSLRLVKNIYAQQVNSMTDLGCCRLPLVLVALSISLEGQLGCASVFQLSMTYEVRFCMCLALISDSARVTKHRQHFPGIGRCLGPTYCIRRKQSFGNPLKSVRTILEEM